MKKSVPVWAWVVMAILVFIIIIFSVFAIEFYKYPCSSEKEFYECYNSYIDLALNYTDLADDYVKLLDCYQKGLLTCDTLIEKYGYLPGLIQQRTDCSYYEEYNDLIKEYNECVDDYNSLLDEGS